MKRQKPLKIYFHHGIYQEVAASPRPIWQRLILLPFVLLYRFCQGIGYAVIGVVAAPLYLGQAVWEGTKSLWQNPGRLRQHTFVRTLGTFVFLAMLAVGIFQSARLVASGQLLKGRVLGSADEGLAALRNAQESLQNQDIAAAQEHFGLALSRFKNSQAELNSSGPILNSLLSVVPQKQDADNLLTAVQLLTEAGLEGSRAYALFNQAKFGAEGLTGIEDPRAALEELGRTIQASSKKLTHATDLLQTINPSTLPGDKQLVFIQTRDALVATEENMGALQEVFDLLQSILLGQKQILLVMQNYNELRPTGGFMGTVGKAHLTDGKITSLDIRTVYDLDGQLKQWIIPPRPIVAVNDHWYLRDSNWLTDFPSSAKQIIKMYEREGGETPSLVVAVTPQVVIDMLKLTGPIALPQYGVTLNADNFVEQTQIATSINYDRALNQPKQMLADFFPALLQKFSDSSGGVVLPLLELFERNLREKHILLYSHTNDLQERLEAFNWAGQMKSTDRDYLLISSANLGGTKTDTHLKRSAQLDSEINNQGGVTNKLTLTIESRLSNSDGMHNTSFIRVYVPEGAKLISASGFDRRQLPLIEDPLAQTDADVLAWEKSIVEDSVTGTLIGRESGKTFFGNWLTVPGGETKTVRLEYILPFTLKSLDHHSLLFQKQAGVLSFDLQYRLHFPDFRTLWKNVLAPDSSTHDLQWHNPVTSDQFIGLVLQK